MSRQAIFEASVRYFLEPIGPLLDDDSVTEIMVNGFDVVYIERRGRLEPTGYRFPTDDALLSAVHNIAQWVGRDISQQRPVLDARLPNGSRVHAVIPPRVDYRLTDLGYGLGEAFCGVWTWAEQNLERIEAARARFDAVKAASA